MPLEVVTTAPGPAALDALAAAVAERQGGNPLAPVTVVVPTNGAGVATRRALARRRPLGNVEFLTVGRLAERYGRTHLAGRRPLSSPLLEAALRATLAQRPGPFAEVAAHAATVAAFGSAYRAVRQLPPEVAARLERQGSPLGRQTASIVRHTAALLAPHWFDAADVLRAGTATVATAPGLDPVVVHLPERDDALAAGFVAALSARVPVRVIAARTGDPEADAEVDAWLGRLGVEVAPVAPPSPVHVDVVTTSDPDDEGRAAVRLVVDAVRAGTPAHRIAVVWTARDPYARLVVDRLAAAGIATHGTDPVSVAERLAGRALLGLLDVDRLGWRRDDVFAVLGSAPLTLPSGRPVPSAAWERVSREAKVHGGAQWDTHLARWRDTLLAGAPADSPDALEHRLAARADALRSFVAELATDLGPRHQPARWAEWARRCHLLMDRYLGGRDAIEGLDAQEQRAFDRVQLALDRLGDLDAVSPPVTRVLFRDSLLAELQDDLGRTGVAGAGVLTGPLGALPGADVDLAVIVGASDATLPTGPVPDPLFSDHDRRLAAGLLPDPSAAVRRHRRALAGVLASAARVAFTVPRGDLRQTAERRASPWIGELVPVEALHERHVASFGAGIEGATFPATAQEHRVRGLARQVRAGGTIDAPAATDPVLHRGLRLVRARRSSAFTEYDGNLSELVLPALAGGPRPLSATQVELWARCPHRYLLERVLGVAVVENPEDVVTIGALDKGSLLHTVLDRFHREVLSGSLACPAPHEPWSTTHRARLLAIFDEEAALAEAVGLTGRRSVWRQTRRALRAHLVRWLIRDDHERAEGGFTPIASEHWFGRDDVPDPWPAAEIALPDGRTVQFRGTVDRVDRADTGGYRVIDHKSGSKHAFTHLERTVHEGGTKLQLLIYAAAVRAAMGEPRAPVRAEYSFLEDISTRPVIGYEVDADKQAALTRALEVIVAGIDGGLFPPYPAAPGFQLFVECPYCDPDGLGTATRYREWTAKRADPRLAPFVKLREPEA